MRSNLKAARLRKGLSMQKLGALIGVSDTYYGTIEYGECRGKINLWLKLSKVLGEPIPYLMEAGEFEGKQLRRLRLEKGMTQREVAAYCGIVQDTYRAIENGLRTSKPEIWAKLSELFKTPIDYESNKQE